MYLKKLTIIKENGGIVREILFREGINLIIDETPSVTGTETGNNVGKTTVLRLIDFCLGIGDGRAIYSDPENRKSEYKPVKDFLISNRVIIQLILKDNLSVENSREVLIERNFLNRSQKILRINNKDLTQDEFLSTLTDLLAPDHYGKKPTFRQLIAHNLRHDEPSLSKTIKHLDAFTKDEEYEALYLFLLGCPFDQGHIKQELKAQLDLEERFKSRLESTQTKSAYEVALALLESEIEQLERRKSGLNLNPNFESILNQLNIVRFQINQASSEASKLELRKNLISEAVREMESDIVKVDFHQLRQIYDQAKSLIPNVQKSFEDLCEFHNRMIESKIRFLTNDLPSLESSLQSKKAALDSLLTHESELAASIAKSDTFADLEELVNHLNEKYRLKGEIDNTINQLNEIDLKLTQLNKEMSIIDFELYSDEFYKLVKEKVNIFNRHFSTVSEELYGEKYALKADIKTTRNNRRVYEFTAFNANLSSGKKQGEIASFDIAYTLFADEQGIPCMHFLLNDKKELMHDNQLVNIANLVDKNHIQFVASMLKDKLPQEINRDEFIVLRLTQTSKLFKIES